MNSAWILVAALAAYSAAYLIYGRFLKRHFDVNPELKTPAHEKEDGVDFVPAKNWLVLFGHHFSSICGAGPIIGPVLGCAYWGWGVSVIWIICGAILMGAVSDFASLIVSVKSKGESIAQISETVISKKVKITFSIFLWISLILVIAVFAIFAAKTFIAEPDAIVPSFGLIPTALLTGFLFYRTKLPNGVAAGIGLALLGALLFLGRNLSPEFQSWGPLSAQNVWIIALLIYCFVASVVPVQVLLQPRDFLASFILFALIGMGLLGVLITRPEITAPAFTAWMPSEFEKAGPLWPMLFVTIACGAISGFHSLVSSGTTCKQISTEAHACRIGYGGMLVESLVAVLVLIAVTAGISRGELVADLKGGGPITAFGHGFGNITSLFLGDYGKPFAILALNAFILTTLDTATRITRYMTSELIGVQNRFLAALIVVMAAGALAMSGKWMVLWPTFGASNQLIAGITLLVASCWLLMRGKNFWVTLVPSLIMLTTTIVAFCLQILGAFQRNPVPDWGVIVIASLLILMAFSILKEALLSLRKQALK